METSIVIPDNSKILTKRPACHTQLLILVKERTPYSEDGQCV